MLTAGRLAAAALLCALAGCSLDTRPALLDRGPQSPGGSPSVTLAGTTGGGGTGGSSSGFGSTTGGSGGQPFNPTPLQPGEVGPGGATPVANDAFGLSCASIPCPVAPTGTEQCCTTGPDVQALTAREVDRCGIDFGDGRCTELEQPGVTDDRCAASTPPGASLEEVGCCTDEGLCGTLNVTHGLGCRYTGDEPPQSCGAELIDESVSCDLEGVYGIRVRVDVAWGGNSNGLFALTDNGRGFIEIHLRAKLDAINGDMTFLSQVLPCGAKLPPFYSSILCESYQPIFPERIWDEGMVPELPVAGRVQCEHPGCVLTMEAVTGLIGIDLDNPEGPWPTAENATRFDCAQGTGLDCYPDHDSDGLPGVTVELLTSGQAPDAPGCGSFDYKAAPLSANPFAIVDGVKRTDRLQLGTRVRLGGSGRIADDCMSGLGGGLADFVQSRAAGCYAQEGSFNVFEPAAGPNDECTNDEALFINQSLPAYLILHHGEAPPSALNLSDSQPSEGPEFSITRLGPVGADVSCEDVRNAAY